MQARKIVISGEVAGLQIQLGTPAFPGRFDSCDLPPKMQNTNNPIILITFYFLKNKVVKWNYPPLISLKLDTI